MIFARIVKAGFAVAVGTAVGVPVAAAASGYMLYRKVLGYPDGGEALLTGAALGFLIGGMAATAIDPKSFDVRLPVGRAW